MNAKLFGARERNSSAYIKIKTNRKRRKMIGKQSSKNSLQTDLGVEHVEDTLIVPVKVNNFTEILASKKIRTFLFESIYACQFLSMI